jgi:16S rRNA (uracil1498-N3)-methyltransferase
MPGDPHPFLVPPERFTVTGELLFPEEEAHHILRVVRLKSGDTCRVVDGLGGRFVVRLEGGEKLLRGTVIESTREARPARSLELGFPMLRLRARTDWMIEKGVEVGVDRFVPIRWERGLKDASAGARVRWERILREAMKQAERAFLPDLGMAEGPAVAAGDRCLTILADPTGDASLPDLTSVKEVRLLIGPEGGAAPEERRRLLDQGAILWGLGATRLRAETAAIVGCHRLSCALRDPVRCSEQA